MRENKICLIIKKEKNMEKKLRNFEENYAELIEFCKREGRLPRKGFRKEESRLKAFIVII